VLLVVGESSSQVGSWSWWASALLNECAAPGLQLPGLVSICPIIVVGRWSPVVLVDGRGASSCSPAAVFDGLVLAERMLVFTPWCPVVVELFFLSLVSWHHVLSSLLS
jgi:hypothetical protein